MCKVYKAVDRRLETKEYAVRIMGAEKGQLLEKLRE